jgi:hypothetical protein
VHNNCAPYKYPRELSSEMSLALLVLCCDCIKLVEPLSRVVKMLMSGRVDFLQERFTR